MSPVNSMFVCIKKKNIKKKKISANLFLKWPISIIGKMLKIGQADNRSTPTLIHSLIEVMMTWNVYLKTQKQVTGLGIEFETF